MKNNIANFRMVFCISTKQIYYVNPSDTTTARIDHTKVLWHENIISNEKKNIKRDTLLEIARSFE